MPRVADFPASNWIRFLSAYGPDSSNLNLFDENVGRVSRRYKIKPLQLETDYVPQIVDLLKEDTPVNVLLAGVAGDGKSFHLRQVWSEISLLEPEIWETDSDITVSVQKRNGETRNVTFIKDLSANVTQFSALLEKLEKTTETDEVFVIACNHGQLLARLREHNRNDLADRLEDVFFRQNAVSSVDNFRVFDLSRVSQVDKLREIIRLIVTHPKWNDCETLHCPHCSVCPIQKNRRALWNFTYNRGSITTERLCRLVEIAAYNGHHFPIRDLFVLAVNALLGCSRDRAMVGCHDVSRLVESMSTADVDVFVNLLGHNVRESTRIKNVIFRILNEFQVGQRGHLYFDELIVLGRQHPNPDVCALYERYFGREEVVFDGLDEDERQKRLVAARRKLFFTWNESVNPVDGGVWALTVYRHIGEFSDLLRNVDYDEHPPEDILQGLSRIMTGSTRAVQSVLNVSTNGASSRAPVGLLAAGKIYVDNGDVIIERSGTGADAVPELVFNLKETEPIRFALTPKRHEFLSNIAEGYIPTSFSGQCQSEFYSLKARLVNALEKQQKRKNNPQLIRLDFSDGISMSLKVLTGNSY